MDEEADEPLFIPYSHFDELEDTDIAPMRPTLRGYSEYESDAGMELLAMAQAAFVAHSVHEVRRYRCIVAYDQNNEPLWEQRIIYSDGREEVA